MRISPLIFVAGLGTAGDFLQSSVFAISLHPVFAHVVFAQDLAGLLRKAPVSAGLRLVAALNQPADHAMPPEKFLWRSCEKKLMGIECL